MNPLSNDNNWRQTMMLKNHSAENNIENNNVEFKKNGDSLLFKHVSATSLASVGMCNALL